MDTTAFVMLLIMGVPAIGGALITYLVMDAIRHFKEN